LDINGLGKETIELLYKGGLISNYSDLYNLKRDDLMTLERMAEKSINNIFIGLEESKKIPFERVLFALGIRYVGQTVSKKLAKEFKSIDNLMTQKLDDLLLVDEIGDRISESIIDFFKIDQNIYIINKLKELGLQFEIMEKSTQKHNILSHNIFVISGIFKNHSRDELKNIIEDNGGKVSSSISSKTNFLLGGDNIGPSKLLKVNKLGIPIISENDLIGMTNSKL
jgi:DNA ligase (NAD+)